MPTGEADTPRQDAKWAFLDAMEKRMPRARGRVAARASIMGDLNVGHREFDIRNWKGNVKKAGFLPRERAYFDRFLGEAGAEVTGVDGSTGPRTRLGRRRPPLPRRGRRARTRGGRCRGHAFDNDTGWRIDYHLATPALAERVTDYSVVRAPSWDTRWSDHSPVVADYTIGG